MEGCSRVLHLRVVPYTRGDEVSRSFDSVMDEVRSLASQGVGEITLLGQNVNAYAGAMDDGTVVDLATLIHYVAEVDGVQRIRFTTSHPVEFGDSLIEAMPMCRSSPITCILRCNRVRPDTEPHEARLHGARIQEAAALRKVRRLRFPPTSLSGFRETERDFQATLKLVREANFDQSFSFI